MTEQTPPKKPRTRRSRDLEIKNLCVDGPIASKVKHDAAINERTVEGQIRYILRKHYEPDAKAVEEQR
jgi:hypothetical protein